MSDHPPQRPVEPEAKANEMAVAEHHPDTELPPAQEPGTPIPPIQAEPVEVPAHIVAAAQALEAQGGAAIDAAALAANGKAAPPEPGDTTLAGINSRLTAVEEQIADWAENRYVPPPLQGITDGLTNDAIAAVNARLDAMEKAVAGHVPILAKIAQFLGL